MKWKTTFRKWQLLVAVAVFPGWSYGQGIIDGFMRGNGNTTVALSYSHESYDRYFVGNRSTVNPNLGTISTKSVNLFASTGLTNYLDLVVALPYIKASASDGFLAPHKGFQDVSVYLKAQTFKSNLGKLGQVSAILAGGISTPISNYVADFPIAIGHQSTNLDGRIVAQYKAPFGLFLSAQGGYIRKSNVAIDRGYEVSVPDVWDGSVKIGFASSLFYADAWIHRQRSKSGTDIGPGVPFPSNAITFTRTGFSLYAPIPRVKKLGISAGMSFTLDGRNIGNATRYSGGIVYNLPSWSGFSPEKK